MKDVSWKIRIGNFLSLTAQMINYATNGVLRRAELKQLQVNQVSRNIAFLVPNYIYL